MSHFHRETSFWLEVLFLFFHPLILSRPIPLLCERSRAPVSGMGTSRGEVKRALAPCAAGASGPRHPVYRAAAHTVLVAWASLRAVRWVISSLSTLCVCLLFIRYFDWVVIWPAQTRTCFQQWYLDQLVYCSRYIWICLVKKMSLISLAFLDVYQVSCWYLYTSSQGSLQCIRW